MTEAGEWSREVMVAGEWVEEVTVAGQCVDGGDASWTVCRWR